MTDRDESEIEASRAPLLDHLFELRSRLIRALIEESASCNARSLSEEIEHRLSKSFEGEATDRHVAAMLSAVIGLIEKK